MKQKREKDKEKSFTWSWGLSNSDPSRYQRLGEIAAKNRFVRTVFDELIIAAGPSCPADMDFVAVDYPKGIPNKVSIKRLATTIKRDTLLTGDDFAACVSMLETSGIIQNVKGLTACCALITELKNKRDGC